MWPFKRAKLNSSGSTLPEYSAPPPPPQPIKSVLATWGEGHNPKRNEPSRFKENSFRIAQKFDKIWIEQYIQQRSGYNDGYGYFWMWAKLSFKGTDSSYYGDTYYYISEQFALNRLLDTSNFSNEGSEYEVKYKDL